jgi:diamine N-acetyltransferase
MPEPDHVLAGERVALGPLRKDLAETYARWINDLDVRRGLANPALLAVEAEEDWVVDAIRKGSEREPEQVNFTVYDRTDGAPVGTTGLVEIAWRSGRATYGIAIGERRGQGLGTEATRLTLDWAFNVLGLENVLLEVLPSNAAAIRAYEKAGFRAIGARRNSMRWLGARCDALLMDAVPADFKSPVVAARGSS